MTTIISDEQRDETLAAWRGAHARLWMYHPSLSRLAVMLSRTEESHSLYVSMVGCESVRARVHWEPAHLRVEALEISGPPTASWRVYDEAGGFEVRCGGVVLVQSQACAFDFYAPGFLREEP